MSGSSRVQVWVTSVLVNDDVEKALILCYSLRKTHTLRQIAVVVSHHVSKNFRLVLMQAFDLVFLLDGDLNKHDVAIEDFSKMYALGCLSSFEVCTFLSPSMLAITNADDIFQQEVNSFRLLPNYKNTSIFLFKPSHDLFVKMINAYGTLKNGANLGEYFHHWQQTFEKNQNFVAEKYFQENNGSLGNDLKLPLGNFVNTSTEMYETGSRNASLLEKLVDSYREGIRNKNVHHLMENLEISTAISNTGGFENESIAIVGMSCRFPGANNLEEFWELLFQAQDGTCTPPDFRWLPEQTKKRINNSGNTNAGFLKVPVDEFDAKFFGISPKEVLGMDPQHRLLHELVWEGLEDACINPHTLHGTPGSVFIGTWTNEYRDILQESGNSDFFRLYMGNSIGAAAARISFLLGMTGPSIATESGCSSAIVAVHLACRNLRNGETNLALAGGVNMLLRPFGTDEMPMMVSPDGRSRTFSEDANGFARAEGGGVLVLKRLSDAQKDGDYIWGLIRGSAVTQEGISKSLGTPTVECESLAMTNALRDANVSPDEVSYVEAHGTGTVVGDPMEVAAVTKAYYSSNRKEPLVIGSVKTNVGHTESCSGVTGIMKVVLAMHNELIPAHKNFTKLNPAIDLNAIPAVISVQQMQWKRTTSRPRIAGVSSFGITGTDAHLILQEPPLSLHSNVLTVDGDMAERPLHVLTISAKTEDAMSTLLNKYRMTIMSSEHSITDIAYSANIGRADFPLRAAIVGENKLAICEAIEEETFLRGETTKVSESLGKICFLFTGQGSQYPGMAKQLYDASPVFRMHFEHCENLLQKMYQISIMDILWPATGTDLENKKFCSYSSLSLFCVQFALVRLWESWGIQPDYVLGHSFGEAAAATCANILSMEDCLQMIFERSQLVDELPSGKMLVIKANQADVEMAMQQFASGDTNKLLDYAAINSNEQTVVAGDPDVISAFSEYCKNNNLKCTFLNTNRAFHSKHMDQILDKYRKAASKIEKGSIIQQTCGYISGMKGDLISAQEITAEYWVQHVRDKVEFLKASKRAVELGCRTFIEIGPQPVLSLLTMFNNPCNLLCLPSLKRKADDWQTLLTSLATLYINGGEVNWKGFDQFRTRQKVHLPHYPFFGKKFWPEITQISGTSIHPLLGSHIYNPSPIKLFQSEVNLKHHAYINDHVIGNTVIFPGAGYLEMCLAAGCAAVYGSFNGIGNAGKPVKIENLTIVSPLALSETKTSHLQTMVDFSSTGFGREQWDETRIKMFHQVDLSDSWIEHAHATFSTVVAPEEFETPRELVTLSKILKTPCEDDAMEKLYQNLAAVGLNFGPAFRSGTKLWKNCGDLKTSATIRIKTPNENVSNPQYLLHPVMLDAMIQAIMFLQSDDTLKKQLHVPVKIGKFVWLADLKNCKMGEHLYVLAYRNSANNGADEEEELTTSDCTAVLQNCLGRTIAIMSNVQLLATTVGAIESVVEQQTKSMPDLWEEVWRHDGESTHYPIKYAMCQKATNVMETFQRDFLDLENSADKRDWKLTFKLLYKLSYYSMLKAFFECGWKPSINQTLAENELMDLLKIQPQFRQQVNYFLNVFHEEGVLTKGKTSGTWTIIREPPSITEILTELSTPLYQQKLIQQFKSTRLITRIANCLSKVLLGTRSAIEILFPAEIHTENEPTVAEFYVEISDLLNYQKPCQHRNRVWLEEYIKQITSAGRENYTLRILEVGAGTGAYTESLLEVLEELGIQYEYTFTDVSNSFFPPARKRFERHAKHIKFTCLNLEEDPLDQGFVPNYYDIVYANLVIHATKDLRETLARVRSLLKTNGIFDMVEMTREIRFVTLMFGLLDGFWCFEDFYIRPNHCVVSLNCWVSLLESVGFQVVGKYAHADEHSSHIRCMASEVISLPEGENEIQNLSKRKIWLIFHQEGDPISNFLLKQFSVLNKSRQVVSVVRSDVFSMSVHSFNVRAQCESDFVNLMKKLVESDRTVEGIVYCWSLTELHDKQEDILMPFFFLAKSLQHLKQSQRPKLSVITRETTSANDIISSLYFQSSTVVGFAKSLRNENLNVHCKCIDVGSTGSTDLLSIFYDLWRVSNEAQIAICEGRRFLPKLSVHRTALKDLGIPVGTDRFQLALPETKSISDLAFVPLHVFTLGEGEIEIQVKSCALNFKDVLNVLKPSEEFKTSNAVGFDFAGVVKRVHPGVSKWRAGDCVFGVNFNGAALPSHSKLHEDDVIAVPDDMTLNEACTLPAVVTTSYYCLVDIAKIRRGDTVLIHTASGGVGLSAIEICKHFGANVIATAGSKRKREYLKSLGTRHVFHSRNTDFGKQILEVTNGRGVDIVLNSLTSEGFKEATLDACAYGARFVEMSKLSIWKPEEIQRLRPDVAYTVIDVSSMESLEWRRLMSKLSGFLAEKIISPVPYVAFSAINIREALTYLQNAKHIGKVVCIMPETQTLEGELKVDTPMFNNRSTYLITGGLGGIGFEVCKWMISKGAKYILLASRNDPLPKIKAAIEKLNGENGAKVKSVQLDVSNFKQCRDLIINRIVQFGYPPLRGIMHAAGSLHDGLIENQSWATFSSTLGPKVKGTLNLHELTKYSKLEHFVLFSSVATLLGLPGQSNHSAGNCFEDAFAHYRISLGLPATSINWGVWSEVGIATDAEIPGIRPFSTLQGISALEYALKSNVTQLAAVNIHSSGQLGKLVPFISSYLDDHNNLLKPTSQKSAGQKKLKSSTFWQEMDAAESLEMKQGTLRQAVFSIFRSILKLDENDCIEDSASLHEMGMDSLMFMELRNALQSLFGERVAIYSNTLKDVDTVEQIFKILFQLIKII